MIVTIRAGRKLRDGSESGIRWLRIWERKKAALAYRLIAVYLRQIGHVQRTSSDVLHTKVDRVSKLMFDAKTPFHVDHFGRSSSLQLYRMVQRFAPSLRLIQDELKLLVVVGSEHRLRLFGRQLKRPRLQRIVTGVPHGLAGAVQLYRARRPVPAAG